MQLPTRVQPSTETNICSRLHQILTALLLGDFCWDQGPCMLHESSVSRDEALTNVSDASRFLTKVWGPWSCYWETSLRPNVFFPWAFCSSLSPKGTASLFLFLACQTQSLPLFSFILLYAASFSDISLLPRGFSSNISPPNSLSWGSCSLSSQPSPG